MRPHWVLGGYASLNFMTYGVRDEHKHKSIVCAMDPASMADLDFVVAESLEDWHYQLAILRVIFLGIPALVVGLLVVDRRVCGGRLGRTGVLAAREAWRRAPGRVPAVAALYASRQAGLDQQETHVRNSIEL